MASAMQRWTSSSEGRSGVVTVPAKEALLVVISQRRRGHLRSGTIPRVCYWSMTASRSTPTLRSRASTP
jgi:hypothetical protein